MVLMMTTYPTGMTPPWFPDSVLVYVVTGRDVYGAVTLASTPVRAKAKIRRTKIEVIENGSRTKKDGVNLKLAVLPAVTVEIGTIVRDKTGIDLQVVEINDRPDHAGIVHFLDVNCIVKATEKVP